jgi:hypothetical protein
MSKDREGIRTVEYKCAKCGAKDSTRLASHEPTPPVLNCWSCHAGMKIPNIAECIQRRAGMFPIEQEA